VAGLQRERADDYKEGEKGENDPHLAAESG
jgi:hypothetical protein